MSGLSIPRDVWLQLDGIDFRLLDELNFLSGLQKKKTGAFYCQPSREYLAAKVGVCVATISRHTTKLKGMNLLDKVVRRKVHGVWQTNLYKVALNMGAWLMNKVSGLFRQPWKKKKQQKRRVRPQAHIACEGGRPADAPTEKALSDCFEKLDPDKKTTLERFSQLAG